MRTRSQFKSERRADTNRNNRKMPVSGASVKLHLQIIGSRAQEAKQKEANANLKKH